jgi:hypothetical protein
MVGALRWVFIGCFSQAAGWQPRCLTHDQGVLTQKPVYTPDTLVTLVWPHPVYTCLTIALVLGTQLRHPHSIGLIPSVPEHIQPEAAPVLQVEGANSIHHHARKQEQRSFTFWSQARKGMSQSSLTGQTSQKWRLRERGVWLLAEYRGAL